tara:strand:+ start:3207 stop:4016 length:810 start_codon:yes stop_codon:yes gene_type:complete
MNDTAVDDFLLVIKTVQVSAFKTLIEALKEILTDANFEFEKNGIKLIAMDTTHTVLVHLKLLAEKFEYYYCPNRVVLGINMMNYFKLIKTMNNSDTLTLYVKKENPNVLGIKIENNEKNQVTVYNLNLMDLHQENIEIPPAIFDSVITLPSSDFQKITREMYNLADRIEIKSVGAQLILSCKGDFATRTTVMGETPGGMSFIENQNPDEIIQGIFRLKNLVLFSKCTNLSNSIEMYLKNDYPLIIMYAVASLGQIKLCLAPELIDDLTS